MKVILFGATGMVGQGVLAACLGDARVSDVLTVGRNKVEQDSPKLRQVVHADLLDLSAIEPDLRAYDACLFCLGVSSVGLSDDDYRHITYDYTLSVARTLAQLNPGSVFVYVSGAGTSETSRLAWAQIKGKTESDLLALPLAAYMLRPGIIQPTGGVTSKTRLYRAAYVAATPILGLLRRVAPNTVVTNDELGAAMVNLAANGSTTKILETRDIRALL